MAKSIKDSLKDLTDSFKTVSGISEQQIKNMEAVVKAAKQAAKEAQNKKV